MYDIITVGSATIDCFVDTGEKLFQQITKHMDEAIVAVPFGSKIAIEKMNFLTGGGGTNTAVAFSRLGLKVAYIGKLGGENSNKILNELAKEKIDTSLIVKGDSTAFSVILDAKGHERTVLTYKACLDFLDFKEINLNKLDAKWMYCSSMMGKSYETLIKLIDYAKKKGIKVAFNPSSYMVKGGYKRLMPVLKNVDALIFNKEEAELLLEEKLEITEIIKKVKSLLGGKEKIVVITNGKNGSHCLADKYYFIAPHDIKVSEGTGAGDAFASGFVAGIIMKKKMPDCLQMGLADAESVIQKMGAKTGLLKLTDMKKIISKTPGKITSKKI